MSESGPNTIATTNGRAGTIAPIEQPTQKDDK